MKVAIVGYGKQGRAAFDYWTQLGAEITVCDRQADLDLPRTAEQQLGEMYLQRLDRFDLIVRGPGVHPNDLVAANSPDILQKVTTVTNEFFRVCPTRNIIGVTGTKGKGTTSTLIYKMLMATGKHVHLAGNIGVPPLDLMKDNIRPDDWVVLELANFQIIDLKQSPHIGVCLMISPEHLDWHTDVNEYFMAKTQLFIHQESNDIAVYYSKNEVSTRVASTSKGTRIPYMAAPGADVVDGYVVINNQRVCAVEDIKLPGQHNWQNICAAVTTVWQVAQDADAIHGVLTTFSGLPYRIEFRREVNGIRYYNDSFASAPAAAVVAIETVSGMKVPIIGGYDRNIDLSELGEAVQRLSPNIRSVLLVGQSRERVAEVFKQHGFTNFKVSAASSMPAIVFDAMELAKPGDAIILTPGFASFDMFKNFEDRGEQFNLATDAL